MKLRTEIYGHGRSKIRNFEIEDMGEMSELIWRELNKPEVEKIVIKRQDRRKISTKCFVVDFKDLIDKKKNPNFSLSAESILNNPKIKKSFLKWK